MKQKGDVIKRACFISLVLFSILGLTVFVGCGSGGGGGDPAPAAGGGTPTSFTTTSLFPLTSSWQTDNWTLFVDKGEHQFNGVPTKIMADTRKPKLLYWTNDQNGLLLHGFMEEEGDRVVFSEPLVVANPTCRIGDIHTGTFFAGPDELKYYIEFVGVKDVTVPAGTFANCMEIRVMIYPVGDLPTDYGYETLWFANNVGFVRAEADDNNFSELFVDAGDTRELLSYHITDVDGLTEDEKELREYGSLFQQYYMAEELDNLMTLVSNDLQYKCLTKDAIGNNLEWIFDNFSDILIIWSTEDVQYNGDLATTFREALTIRKNDNTLAREWIWNRESRVYKKEIDGWKWYGDQLDFRTDFVNVMLRNTASGGTYNPMEAAFVDCSDDQYIDSPDMIASLTVTGPPGSDLDGQDLKPSWEDDGSWRGFWDADSLQNAVSGFYTFRVEEPDGDYFIRTDYLDATHRLAPPVHLAPAADARGVTSGTLEWEPVDLAHAYRVDWRSRPAGGTDWNYMDNQYTDATQVTVPLSADTEYIWRVRARRFDVFGEMDSESRSDYIWFQTAP